MQDSQSSDKTITQQIGHKLANRGMGSPCQVAVQTKKGEVTLTGTVQYPHQKKTAVNAVTGITGVRRVIDQLTVKARVWK